MAKAGTHTTEMLPPRRSPRPRRNHACGATKVSLDSTPGAWETGKNVPPTRPRMTATTDCQFAACSAFLASVAMRAMIPVAARIGGDDQHRDAERVPPRCPEQQGGGHHQHGHADGAEQEAGQQLPAEDRGRG